jgi:purine-nucleoside phosphorylase
MSDRSGSLYDRVEESAAWIRARVSAQPKVALVLGSGLGRMAERLYKRQSFEYSEIPHFPSSSVAGHAGKLVFGFLGRKFVVIMQGRSHLYEGYSAAEVSFPIRVFSSLGSERLLVTNSAGGISPQFRVGDLMMITDHLNLMGVNPLTGPNEERFGPRFIDMSFAYHPEMQEAIVGAARALNIPLQAGVYAGLSGPSYETPAEIKMLSVLGAQAVGMSTVPEVIVANHMGMKVGGISCISNLAAGISDTKLDHSEVAATAALVREPFGKLIKKTVSLLR